MDKALPGSLHQILGDLAYRFGVSLPEGMEQRLADFCDLLLDWNQRINLTGARSRDVLLTEHFPDSFAMANLVSPGARLVDVGSGGGLPALPFALLRPDAAVTLVEPRSRRAAFLRTAIQSLRLGNALVEQGRLEDLPPALKGFDAAASRATFPPGAWLERARPLVRVGGRILIFTTPAERVGLALGANLSADVAYVLHSGQERVLLAVDSAGVPR